jgi:small-conductance mechanosensitive channel/CRP-like cAMP-binding protein
VNQYFPAIVEVTILLIIWLATLTVTARWHKRHKEGSGLAAPSGFTSLLIYILRPALILSITNAVRVILMQTTFGHRWLPEFHLHLEAWNLFWSGVGLLLLIEGLALLFFKRRGQSFPIPDLLLDIIRLLLVLGIAFGIFKFKLGVNIGPLLASTALLTAVIGFALQGVLGNLMAGMSLHIARSVMPGDWVSVGDTEGKVMKTNWRETRIRTTGGHMMIVPNATISESIIHNISRPNPMRRHNVYVGASYSDNPDEVIEALVAAAKEVHEVAANPSPEAWVTEYQDFGINYVCRFWSRDYHRRVEIEGNVMRMVWYKFKRAGIEIPFPMSDQLLNDFMAVVYNQRSLDPTDKIIEGITTDLLASDLVTQLVLDGEGGPLLDRSDLEAIAPLVKRNLFTKGEILFHQGDEGNTCSILVKGKLSGNVRGDDGAEIASFTMDPGTVVGEMSLILGAPRSAEIVVSEPSVLLEIGPEAFRALLALREEVPHAFARLASERAVANSAALEKWAASKKNSIPLDMTETGFMKRFMRIIGR